MVVSYAQRWWGGDFAKIKMVVVVVSLVVFLVQRW